MPEYELFASFRFELQIRTIVQDSWSTLDHKIKYKKSIPASLKRRINTLAALFELADREFRQVRDDTERQIAKAGAEPEPGPEQEAEPETDGRGEHFAQPMAGGDDIERGQYAPLDAFRLLRIAHHFFPEETFDPAKIDGFTAEIIDREPTISRGKFNHYLRAKIAYVRRYRTYFLGNGNAEKFNAFAQMRHALYAANPELFASMLTNVARDTFDAWRAENPPGGN